MITSLDVLDPTKTHISWWNKVDALKAPQTFSFTPGLNVLWGENGSGKTTLIKALARLTHCEQSGWPVLTQTSLRNLCERWSFDDPSVLKEGVVLHHDGRGVRCFEPGNAVGLDHSSFDDDFFEAGVGNAIFKGSLGQTTAHRISSLLTEVIKDPDYSPPLVRRVTREHINDAWQKKLDLADYYLEGGRENPGPSTILLDEPGQGLDLPRQFGIWKFIRAYSPFVQFIVASHSFYALGIPGANYIELTKGYLEQSLLCCEQLKNWSDREFKPIDPGALKRGNRVSIEEKEK